MNRDSALCELQTVRLVSPFGTSVVYRHPQPFAYVVDRERFDRNLASEARARGAEIVLSTKAEDVLVSEEGVRVRAREAGGSRSLYSARMAVLASGIDFGLHAKLGLGRPEGIPERSPGGDRDGRKPPPPSSSAATSRPGHSPGRSRPGPRASGSGVLTKREPRTYLARLAGTMFPDRYADAAPTGSGSRRSPRACFRGPTRNASLPSARPRGTSRRRPAAGSPSG